VGGGPAGICAAIASSRTGAETILIERLGYLGGTATASLMACINGFRNQVEPDFTQTVKGIAEEIVLDLKKMDGLGVSPYPQKFYPTVPGQMAYSYAIDIEKFKYLVLKKCIEAGVEILFHSRFCHVIKSNNELKGVIVENKSGRQAISANIVVDASGDGDVAACAGAPFWQVTADEKPRLNDALMYRIQFGRRRPTKPFACDFGSNAVVWGPSANPINGVDAVQLSKAEIETRLQVFDDFEKKQQQHPELRDAVVLETPPMLGIRQTRFIEGEYKITAEDALKGTRFDDVVAISSCAIISYYGYRRYLEHEGYDIPYRSLLPQKIDNLLIAGRCISSEQQPYESHRAMIPIMAIGQAAGTAAALSALEDVKPKFLDVTVLQNQLLAQNVELRK
jgi:hypothetical protein